MKTNKIAKFQVITLFSIMIFISSIGLSSDNGGKVINNDEKTNLNPKVSAGTLNITTPENITYTAPMSGYYPGTYGFENDTAGVTPSAWSDISDPSSWARAANSYNGHNKVVQIYKGGFQSSGIMRNSFSSKTSGSIELWALTTPTSNLENTPMRLMEGGSLVFSAGFFGNGSFFALDGVINEYSTYNYTENQWYHFRADFDCSSDKYNLTVTNSTGSVVWQINNLDFFAARSYGNNFDSNTNWGTAGTFSLYVDAVGYSWDPNYNLGDNLKEGLLLSYENSTNLEWIGYSLDAQANKTIYGNATSIPMPNYGLHALQLFGNESDSTAHESLVRYFSFYSINIITPENITYTAPMSGYYPGTYGFENDTAGVTPSAWSDISDPSSWARAANSYNGHNKVAQIYKGGFQSAGIMRNSFSSKTSGSIELWALTTPTSNLENTPMRLMEDGSLVFSAGFFGNGSFFALDGVINEYSTYNYTENQWYHFRADFDCSSDKYNLTVTDSTGSVVWQINNLDFFAARSYGNNFDSSTNWGTAGTFSLYVDAVGYSWDPNYNLGDNLKEGLLLSYEYGPNLDWIGYSLDGQANKTISGNFTIPLPVNGSHSIQVFGNETDSTMYNSNIRYFFVGTIASPGTTDPPDDDPPPGDIPPGIPGFDLLLIIPIVGIASLIFTMRRKFITQ